jgi:glycosyltransferase involved in cell wall biosynthesis
VTKVDQLFFRIIDRGGETVAVNLAAGLTKRGYDVDSVGFFRDRQDAAPVTATWQVLAPGRHTARSATPRALKAWVRRLRTRKPDVVLAHTQVASLLGLGLAGLLGVRRRIAIHHQPHGRDLGWPFWLSDAIFGSLGVYTDVVLVSHVNLDAIDHFPRWYKRRVTLLPNEVPPPELPDRGEARAALDLPPDHTVFCFLGAITERKGAQVAARAVAADPTAVLLLAGRPGDASAIVEQLSVESDGRIRTLGHLTRSEVEQVLAASDALLFPSQAENRSLTVLEALSAGLAVVASDIPGNRYILDHADGEGEPAGLLLDPSNQALWNSAVAELGGDRQPDSPLAQLQARATPDGRWDSLLDRYEAVIDRRPGQQPQ